MRIFIGIMPDRAVHEKIEKFLKPFKKMSSPIRWVNPANVHLTLKFIGDVSIEKFKQIETALLEAVPKDGPILLDLTGCGKFGKNDSLSIFWLGTADNPRLNALYLSIENALERVGVPKEPRPFKAHITVGRNKRDFNFKSLFTRMDELSHQPIAQLEAASVILFKSDLKPSGPVYSVLKEIPLSHVQF